MAAALSNECVSARAQADEPRERTGRAKTGKPFTAPTTELKVFAGRKPAPRTNGILRHSPWDALFAGLALAHGVVLIVCPSIPLIALGLWWNANTIAHNFIHLPFFRSCALNAQFSAFESLVLGIPQRLWRDRHLAHHADKPWRRRWSNQLVWETSLVLALWSLLLIFAPGFFLKVYLPGWFIGLGLCCLQGYFEHTRGVTSHYGWSYNLLFFNDGYHVEHHARPAEHWSRLPQRQRPRAQASRWPAVLRWLEHFSLDGLERLVLRSNALQRFVLEKHERAFRNLLADLPPVHSVGIVGGGLFPRTALILCRLLPDAELTIIDTNATHLATARRFLNGEGRYAHRFFHAVTEDEFDGAMRIAGQERRSPDRQEAERRSGHRAEQELGAPVSAVDSRSQSPLTFDLLVIPLAFIGDRATIYRRPPAPAVLVHDWLWHRRGAGVTISPLLLKRLNLVKQ